jgi:hypothetical protein
LTKSSSIVANAGSTSRAVRRARPPNAAGRTGRRQAGRRGAGAQQLAARPQCACSRPAKPTETPMTGRGSARAAALSPTSAESCSTADRRPRCVGNETREPDSTARRRGRSPALARWRISARPDAAVAICVRQCAQSSPPQCACESARVRPPCRHRVSGGAGREDRCARRAYRRWHARTGLPPQTSTTSRRRAGVEHRASARARPCARSLDDGWWRRPAHGGGSAPEVHGALPRPSAANLVLPAPAQVDGTRGSSGSTAAACVARPHARTPRDGTSTCEPAPAHCGGVCRLRNRRSAAAHLGRGVRTARCEQPPGATGACSF